MKWHIYKTVCNDAFWNNLKTVAETERQIMRGEAVSIFTADTQPECPDAMAFAQGWEAARNAAGEKGWDGVERGDTTVFWLPSRSDFVYGFVIKPAIDEKTTYIASPCRLAWLSAL